MMFNIEAGKAEKGTSSNVHTTSDHGGAALHIEDESISSPPDGGYGGTTVVAIMFLNAVTWGMAVLLMARTSANLTQVSTRRLESIYRTWRHSRPSRTLLHLCTHLSGVFRLLLLCYALPWRTS
jgi:hypothetical protein